MFSQKKRLIKQSQQYRKVSQALKVEGVKKILVGSARIGLTMVSGNVLSDVINGYRGGSTIGEGLEILDAASKHDESAKLLEKKANKSKWWHL